jgi:thiol-disulfide isomerase/thioredoxin
MSREENMGGKYQRRLKGWFVQLLVLIMTLFLIHLWQTRNLVEGHAPSLSGQTLHGEWFDLEKQTEWPLLIHFWATWCPVCKFETGGIASMSEDYPVVTIAMQSGSKQDVARFLDEHHFHLPVINDPDGVLADTWAVTGVPTSFIVDRGGRIRFSSVGYTLPVTLRIRLWLTGIW